MAQLSKLNDLSNFNEFGTTNQRTSKLLIIVCGKWQWL